MTGILTQIYRQKGLQENAQQEKTLEALERLHRKLLRPRRKGFLGLGGTAAPRGVYMHGGVGRGKSMMMDMFFQSIPETAAKKRRVHFHEFMIETHDWMHKGQGLKVDNLLPRYAAYVAETARLLCFDEFHVVDVADAMILSRLFSALFDKGVTVVATSNWEPERLYEGGLQRELFLPFIDLIRENMEVVHLDSETDYRTTVEQDQDYYFWPLNAETEAKFDRLFAQMTGGQTPQLKKLIVKGRNLLMACANGVARCSFDDLCERPHGAEDYLTIAASFDTLFLEGVPKMGQEKRNEVKRLMSLVDVLYDKRKKLVISAAAPPDRLYYGIDHRFEFDRTISRIQEMQSSSYRGDEVTSADNDETAD